MNKNKQYYPSPEGEIERDLNYTSRGRGYELGDTLPGYADFVGNGAPEDNSQDDDVQGEGYTKKGTWTGNNKSDSIKSDKQP